MDTPDELLEPFSTAVATAVREMAGAEVVVRGVARATGGGPAGVSVVLRLEADVPGRLVLSLPPATAAALARRVLAEAGGEPDPAMVRDCAAEVLNVIAGQAKALLFGTPHHFTLSTPRVLTPGALEVSAADWVVGFDSDVGEFTLHVRPPRAAGTGGGARPGDGPGGE